MVRERLRAPLIVAALIAVSACDASYPFQPSAPTISALYVLYQFSPAGPLIAGISVPLSAITVNSDGATEGVSLQATWQSSNDAVARVVSNIPRFTAVAPGVADISATYQGFVRTITVTVYEPEATFPRLTLRGAGTLTPLQIIASLRLNPDQSQDVSGQAAWTSSNPGIATVTVSGSTALVTAVSPGTVEITAAFNGLRASVGYSVSYPAE